MTRRLVWLVFFACVGLLALPSVAHAQSGIAGVVKDPSGAVLPGVTVEASSDVLIEKTRTVVTDGAGLFNIINLRPGTYVVTFTLTGFQTYKREGLELPGGFTANVDAIMKVGSLEESVTVSGASPVVDVSSNTKSAVLTREVLDSVPNAHTIQSVGQLIPGVSLTSPDVGGSVQMQQTYFAVHGFGASGTSVMMDGMVINTLLNDGAIQSYFTTAGSQEMVYQTGGGGGEAPTGGLNINMVPREGGNRFTGTSSLGLENWQSDNFGQELKNLGVTSTDKLGSYHDFDVAEGGPIKKDRIWFFGVGRLSHENKPVANTTNVTAVPGWSHRDAHQCDAERCAPHRVPQCAGGRWRSDRGVPTGLQRGDHQQRAWPRHDAGRLEGQAAALHGPRAQGSRRGPGGERRSGRHVHPLDLAELHDRRGQDDGHAHQPAPRRRRLVERHRALRHVLPGRPRAGLLHATLVQLVARNNTTDSRFTVAPVGEGRTYPDRYNWQGSTSYVTGAHNVKVGFLYSKGTFILGNYRNGDMVQQYQTNSAGLTNQPYQATLYPTDPRYSNNLKFLGDFYAQDSWTHKRLTVTGGIRYDFVQESAGGYPAQQGTFEDDSGLRHQGHAEADQLVAAHLGCARRVRQRARRLYAPGSTTLPRLPRTIW